jgi:hypothetical protein
MLCVFEYTLQQNHVVLAVTATYGYALNNTAPIHQYTLAYHQLVQMTCSCAVMLLRLILVVV